MKRWTHGPWGDCFWYMQSDDDVADYMEERGEWMLENHDEVAGRIDTTYKRHARDRKRIGESLALWLPATTKTTRGKGAPFIVGDEIDAWMKRIMKGVLPILRARQSEFGNEALLYLASHPDAGPAFGIESVIAQGLRHLWWWLCPYRNCRKPSSPLPEARVRMEWNVPELLKKLDGADKPEILGVVREKTVLICPHCRRPVTEEMRLEMSSSSGAWLQPHQRLLERKQVRGKPALQEIMGFCIHAFMGPFVPVGKLAGDFVGASLEYSETKDDTSLKEVTVKRLGEVYEGASDAEKIEDWHVVKSRMLAGGGYLMGQVPPGVDFLTAFVDNQVYGFEVRVIGWSVQREAWLIDAFPIKAWPDIAGSTIDPFNRLGDWSVLEGMVLRQSYQLIGRPGWYLPIAKVAIDLGGGYGDDTSATNNARLWSSQAIARAKDPIPEWQILLMRGSAHRTGELYGIPRQVMKDDRGVALPAPVWERAANVHNVKRIIATRMKISLPGPGMMHAPQDLPDKYFRELTSERLDAGRWLPKGRNETWDAFVACEVARESLKPEREGLITATRRPSWARPFRPGVDPGIDTKPRSLVSHYQRLAIFNTGEDEERR